MTKCKLLFALVFAFAFGYSVNFALASSVYPSTPSQLVPAGSTFFVDVFLNTEGKVLNAVEGQVEITSENKNFTIADIVLGGSELNLWTEKPQLAAVNNGTVIKFTGGSTQGFNKPSALLFKVAVTGSAPGSIQVLPKAIKTFLHDGTGTSQEGSVKNLTIQVSEAQDGISSQDSLKELISQDNIPPEPFKIDLGVDPNSFDGKYFISFISQDAGSGIAYYEVKEGANSAVRTGSPYVLLDQSLQSKIIVAAYDKAGNARVMTWEPESVGYWSKLLGRAIVLLSAVLILFGAWAIFRLIRNVWSKWKQKV